jgi:hydroxyacylglutathione hydrolase
MLTVHCFVFSPIAENTYILYNQQKDCVIIDPGCYDEEEQQQLLQYIASNGLKPIAVLNTHGHLDHVFGNKLVIDTYKIPLYLHAKEEWVLKNAPVSALHFNLPFEGYQGPLQFLTQQDIVQVGEDVLSVIEAPGHSPGHICFYCAPQHFLIGGDVLFKKGIGRTDLPGGDLNTLLHSIQTQLFTLPNETLVYPGHGPTTTIGREGSR